MTFVSSVSFRSHFIQSSHGLCISDLVRMLFRYIFYCWMVRLQYLDHCAPLCGIPPSLSPSLCARARVCGGGRGRGCASTHVPVPGGPAAAAQPTAVVNIYAIYRSQYTQHIVMCVHAPVLMCCGLALAQCVRPCRCTSIPPHAAHAPGPGYVATSLRSL